MPDYRYSRHPWRQQPVQQRQRRQQKQQQQKHHVTSSRDDPPGLANALSVSSGSSSSENVRRRQSASPRYEQHHQQHHGHQYSKKQSTHQGSKAFQSDRHVMKGAEILRNQIVEGSFQDDEAIMQLHSRSSLGKDEDDANEYDDIQKDKDSLALLLFPDPAVEPYFEDDDDASDWSDPRPPPSPSREYAETYFSDDSSDEADDVQNVAFGSNDNDENTAFLLAKAKQFGLAGQFADSSSSHQKSSISGEKETNHNRMSFSNFQCGAFESGLLASAVGAISGSQKHLLPSSTTTTRTSNNATTNTLSSENSYDLLNDLRKKEAEMYPSASSPKALSQTKEESSHKSRKPILSFVESPRHVKGPNPAKCVVPLNTNQYCRLMKDEGFCHALRAGSLWQSIVSQHVRFPKTWWHGARNPPMGVSQPRPWVFLGRHRVRANPLLLGLIHHRNAPGRLLLHVIVRDLLTGEPVLDIAVGAFHPNARGVRSTPSANPSLEPCRDIWLAVRPRSEEETTIESLLRQHQKAEESPLGSKRAINNTNLRPVFGERPPFHTTMITESDLYEVFSQRMNSTSSAAILLEKFFQEW